MCVAVAPEMFELGDDDVAMIVGAIDGSEEEEEALRSAVACCPVDAIQLTEER